MELQNSRTGLEKKFYDLFKEIIENEKLALYDLEYHPVQSLLRVYILNEATNTALLDDCVHIDRVLTPFIEKEDWVPETLTLEVSSPGVYRPLRTLEHFQRAIGQWVAVTVSKNWDEGINPDLPKKYKGLKKYRGILKEAGQDDFILDLQDCLLKIPYDAIKKAHLDPEMPK